LSLPAGGSIRLSLGWTTGEEDIDAAGAAVCAIVERWSTLHAGDIYRTDAMGALGNAAHWISSLLLGWIVRTHPRSLFDNSPLESLLPRLIELSQKHGIHLAFEGGEAETLTLDGPIFKKKVIIQESEKNWQVDSGQLTVKKAILGDK